MNIGRYAAWTALLAAASIGLAGPANAEWTDGTYAYTDPDSPGQTLSTWVVSSCGAGCKHVEVPETGGQLEFHLQGSAWSQTAPPLPSGCTYTLDDGSLAAVSSCGGLSLQRQLAKNG